MPTFAWPIEAQASRHGKMGPRHISSDFGPRSKPCADCSSFHQGLDIGVDTGTNVLATADGTVHLIKEDSGTAGTYVVVKHDDNYWSRYLHLSGYDVAEGDRVKKGQIIAPSGGAKGAWGAGSSQGPHLHFEIWRGEPREDGSEALDPETLLTEERAAVSKADAMKMMSSEGTGRTLLIVGGVSVAALLVSLAWVYKDDIRARLAPKRQAALAGPALANPRRRKKSRAKRRAR